MDPLPKDGLAVIILLSFWTGTAARISYTVVSLSSPGSPCQLELSCLSTAETFVWYRGTTKVSDDSRHKVTFGGRMLTVSPDKGGDGTVYKCSSSQPQEEISIDVAPACSEVLALAGSCPGGCSVVMVAVKGTVLCLWLSAVGFTVYYCRKISQEIQHMKEKATAKVVEEGIYSHVGTFDTGNVDSPEEERPGPSSAKEDPDAPNQGLNKEKRSDNSMISPEAASVKSHDPTYQALDKDTDEEYHTLKSEAAGGEPFVKFSAQKEEAVVEISLQGGTMTQE